jgi:arylsulfatase A-like enzyme
MSSLVTSTPPWVHGQGAPASGVGEVVTLAERFAEEGYRTGAFTEVAWPLLQRGFETFQNTAFKHTFGDPEANSATRTIEAALEWAGQDDSRPFFLLVHTYEVHSYFLGKPRHHEAAQRERPTYDGPFRDWGIRDLSRPAGPQVIEALLQANEDDLAYVRALYRGAVAEVDAEIGHLVAGLEDAGLSDRTVLVLTSSNGEGFRPDLKRVHHGGRLHHDLLHVPLIVRWPGHLDPSVDPSLVATLDVGPTLLALAGLPEESRFAGRPLFAPETGLLPSLGGPHFRLPKRPKLPVVAQEAAFRTLASGERESATTPQFALYSDWVILIDTGEDAELYDLKDDPEQENDLSADYAEGVERLRKKVHRIAEQAGSAASTPDAEQMEQLRSLGYVQ